MKMFAERDYRLKLTDFDRFGRLHPACVLDVFQDVAIVQAGEMGIGLQDMLARGCMWAITRMKYEVLRSPEPHQVVTARTWPHTLTSFSFLRDYYMKSLDGELLVKATSEWVVMDAATRKFVSIKDIYTGPADFEQDRSFDAKPRKLPRFSEEGLEPYTVVPGYSDVDVNGHINNSRYANYIVNALNPAEGRSIKTFQIDFRQEVHEGEPLRIYTHMGDGTVDAKGLNADGAMMFASHIELADE